jgi:Kelch motif/Galactose oxidase, central domain
MTYEIFSSIKSHIIRWPRHLLMAGSLCLLVACGGGGGGGSASPSTTAPPTVTFTQVNSGATVYSGNRVQMTPSFNYGSGVITWTDGNGQAQTRQVVNPGTPIDDYPTANTTYTLTVRYQDPTTVRPNELTTTKTITVSITPIDLVQPTLTLTTSPAGSVAFGTTVAVTPTITYDSTKIRIVASTVNNSVTNTNTTITSGVAINQNVTANTVFTLRVEYVDIRETPNRTFPALTTTATVTISTDPLPLTQAASLSAGRSEQISMMLGNNRVLVAGGTTNGTLPVKTAELYNPDTNTWSATGSMVVTRRGHTATLLLDGKVLVTGGFDGTVESPTAEIYDPATGIWTATGPMGRGRKYHTATRLGDGKVLIAGGIVATNVGNARIAEIYDPSLGTFTSMPITPSSALMSAPRYKHTASVLNDGVTVVLTGGFDSAVQGTTEIFTYNAATPTSSTWAAGPALAKSRHDHSASLLTGNRKILLTGGYGQGLDTAEICDFSLVTPACATTTSMSTSRASHTSTLLGNGNVLVIGGNDGSQILKTIEVFDPTTLIWTSHAKVLQTARAGHSSTLMSNGKVLISGANNQVGGVTTATAELWIP